MGLQDERISSECARCNVIGSTRPHGPKRKHNKRYHLQVWSSRCQEWQESMWGHLHTELELAFQEVKSLAWVGCEYRVVDQENNVYEAIPVTKEEDDAFAALLAKPGSITKTKKRVIYLVGSLRNPKVLEVAAALRGAGHEVFDDWYSAGQKADDEWQAYSKQRGWNYREALEGYSAQHVFNFDKKHILRCDTALLVLPAGKSGHLELGVVLGLALAGQNKEGYILIDGEPERYDVMYNFANKVFLSTDEAVDHLTKG